MSDAKLIRKQLRNVVQEHMPEVMSSELYNAVYKKINDQVDARLHALEAHVKQALTAIDSRAKDVQSLIVREMLAVKAQAPVEAALPQVEDSNGKS